MYLRSRRHTLGGNVLFARSEIGCDGKNQRGAIFHFNQLLLRSSAVGAFADGAAALVVRDGRGQNFSGSGGAVADQYSDGFGPDNFRRIGGRDDGRDRLALQRRDRARRKEKLRGLNTFLVVAERRIVQIEQQLLRAGFLELHQLFANLFRNSRREFRYAQISGVAIQAVFHQLGRRELRKSDVHFLRLRFAATNHGKLHGGSRIAFQQQLRLINGHLASRESRDLFQDVADAQADFRARAVRQHADHADVTEAARERQTAFRRRIAGALFLEVFVLKRAQVGRLRVQRIKQPVQRSVGDSVHVRFVHVIALDVFQDFAVNGERA